MSLYKGLDAPSDNFNLDFCSAIRLIVCLRTRCDAVFFRFFSVSVLFFLFLAFLFISTLNSLDVIVLDLFLVSNSIFVISMFANLLCKW